MARSNSQIVLPVTGSGRSIAEVLDGLVRDVAARSGWTGGDSGGQLATQLEQLRLTSQAQADAVAQNTQAILQNTIARAAGGGVSAGGIGNIFSKVIGSGLGLVPLVSGLVKLFGREESEPVTVLTPYTKPASISFEGSISASGADEARKYQPDGGGQHITIQVQAMDSRSFLDHSEEIARAVREAMLNSHALNDVVNDL
ncbi:MAG: hypothetical protein ACM3S5_08205 [Rhodospirillales bacterium]